MTDSTLSTLSAASALDGTELHYVVQGGADRKATGAQISTYVAGSATSLGAMTVAWNSSGTAYTGVGLAITDSGSAASSWVFNFQRNSTTMFGMRKDGAIQFGGTYLSLNIPDNTATGGNDRGVGAVDLQVSRTTATQVASGTSSVAIGVNCTASGSNSIALGNGASSSGSNSIALGNNASASSNFSVSIGNGNTVSGANSIGTGLTGSDRGLGGSHTHGGLLFSATGDNQTRMVILAGQTTNGTPAVLTYDHTAASASNQVNLPNDSSCFFEVQVIARRTDADGDNAAFTLVGCLARNTNAASTALVGTVTKTVVARISAAWDVAATADTTLGGLAITVTGEAAKNITWVARVRTVEVVG